MMGHSLPIRGTLRIAPWRRQVLLATAMLMGAEGARAQDEAAGGAFLPVPEEILTALSDLSGADDPIEIAHQIRESVSVTTQVPSSVDQLLGSSGVNPVAFTGRELSEAIEASIESGEAAPTAPSAVISVIVENVDTNGGTVNIGLCDRGLSRDTCPYDKEVRASAGFVEATFESVRPGNYAVVAYHDVNGNGQFDRFLGLPREPYALSGRAATQMVPTFEAATLPMRTGENAVVIRLKRLVSR